MVGVQDFEECPQCGYPQAFVEFQTRNFQERIHCEWCGFYILCVVHPGDEDEIVEVRNGHGAYSIVYHQGFGEFGSFRADITEESIMELYDYLCNDESVDIDGCFATIADGQQVKCVFGKMLEEEWSL